MQRRISRYVSENKTKIVKGKQKRKRVFVDRLGQFIQIHLNFSCSGVDEGVLGVITRYGESEGSWRMAK